MKKLSPTYMNESTEGLPDELRDYLDKEFFEKLPNVNVSNPKLLVTYSGGSAVGKSTLSAKLRDELNGLVLENDAVRAFLQKNRPDLPKDERNMLFWQYTMSTYKRISQLSKNGLIIRDGVVDWYYDRILPTFLDQGFEIFVIAFDISRKKREELIRQRGDKETVSVERLIELMDEQDFHINRFRQYYKPDITLNDDDMFDHDKVVKAIKDKLDSLK